MNKQEILKHISDFCPDIEVDDERYVYTDNIYVCGLEIMNDAISIFYPYHSKEKCELYRGINNYADILDIWAEYRFRLNKVKSKLVQSSS
jgi:hypothetical protein